jgi:hypothetical protein
MADDDLEEEFDPDAVEEEIDDEVDPDAIDPDAIEDDLVDEEDDDDLATGDDFEDEAVPAEVVEAPVAAVPPKKKTADDEEDDEEELDPDDVEADLDTILKDRIAAADDEDDEDELDEQPRATTEAPDGVVPKRANEFMCPGCFLLVNRGQFGPESNLQCPVGESECPAINLLQATPAAPTRSRTAKSGRKR